jgi:hypothetical protein
MLRAGYDHVNVTKKKHTDSDSRHLLFIFRSDSQLLLNLTIRVMNVVLRDGKVTVK